MQLKANTSSTKNREKKNPIWNVTEVVINNSACEEIV